MMERPESPRVGNSRSGATQTHHQRNKGAPAPASPLPPSCSFAAWLPNDTTGEYRSNTANDWLTEHRRTISMVPEEVECGRATC